jgi:hypothetical protein
LIIKTNVFTLSWDIQRSKIGRDYYYGCKIWQNMLIHCFSDHDRQHFFRPKNEKKEKHKGIIDVKLTYEAKCFHKWTRVYNPYKYKTPNPPKNVVKHHHIVSRVCDTKKCSNYMAKWPHFFLPWLLSMNSRVCHLLPKLLFFTKQTTTNVQWFLKSTNYAS